MVSICVACVHHNVEQQKGFPLVCPKMMLPCMAIDPQFVLDKKKRTELYRATMPSGRATGLFIDPQFIQNMQEGYEEGLLKGFDFSKAKSY